MARDPTCVFAVDADLIAALEASYGPPIDSYLNGWQVWLEPSRLSDESGEPVTLEHRLHPPYGFELPPQASHHDLWETVVEQLADGARTLRLGEEDVELSDVWELLEVYPVYADVPVEALRSVAEEMLGADALAAGVVDHDRLGARWKRSKGHFDLVGALRTELGLG